MLNYFDWSMHPLALNSDIMDNQIATIESLGGPLIEQANQLAIDSAQITEVDELNEHEAVQTMLSVDGFLD